ncbi:DUF4259 domain-containing protein [Kitasatospora sp. NPDC056184]|uniref:DUF4259 domain-containing protein n=1 Tax=Kitasatospora sp. NPDC056184 TaxID=3345738 RepID=UPI0035D56A52
MGTWDIGHFDNDTAADFSGALDDAAPAEREAVIRRVLTDVVGTASDDYLDSYEAAKAVAAAALIAAQCPGGEPVTTSYGPEQPLPTFPDDFRPLAAEALDRVLADESELAELWDESEDAAAWRRTVADLRAVLVPEPAAAS